MQTNKETERPLASNTVTRELFLDASANEPASEKLLDIEEGEDDSTSLQEAADERA